MKRTLTLGLLVFFVGVLMTACGSKSSSPAAPTNNTNFDLNNQDPACMNSSSGCDLNATYQITDAQAYADTFGYSSNQDLTIEPFYNDQGSNWGGFWDSLRNVGGRCGTSYLWARFWSRVTDSDIDFECAVQVSNGTSSQLAAEQLASSYNSNMSVYYNNGRADRVDVHIPTGSNNGNGDNVQFYYDEGDNAYYTNDRSIGLFPGNGVFSMRTPEGEIGVLRPRTI